MSPSHPPTIDLNALRGKLNDVVDEPLAASLSSREERGIATLALQTARGNGNAGQFQDAERPDERETAPPVPRLGVEAADNMKRLSKAAADDIRQLGRLAFEAGKRVHEECEQMARDVEANGGTVALHLTGLSQLLADVGMSNRETLRRLLGDVSPSIVPPSGRVGVHAAKQTAREEKPIETIPFAKKPRRTD
jgi:hypothetical protein